MQAARLLEPRAPHTWLAKLKQIYRAWQLEARFSKKEILEIYLALAPYGGNVEGLRAASLTYFGKEPRRLSYGEAALLVALPQAPEARRPDHFPARARAARDRVIDRALAGHALGAEEARRAKAEPPPLQRKDFPNLAAQVTDQLVKTHPERRVFHLAYDARLQRSLEDLARRKCERLGPKLTAALIVIDNANGHVLAHVGGADYFSKERAGALDMARALRSPGSTIKPFIYATAFAEGLAHPETLLDDSPARYGLWRPVNFDEAFHGAVTARKALQFSLNLPAAQLLNEVGPARLLARLRSAGLVLKLPKDSDVGLAIGLGGVGARLIDLARAFAAFAREGVAPDLVESLDDLPPLQNRRLTEPASAWQIADILRGAPPPENASADRIAFKTGTSYGYRDALAIGFDRAHTIAVWVGRADNAPVPGLIGRQVAAPILFDAFARLGGANQPPAAAAPIAAWPRENHRSDFRPSAENLLSARRRAHRLGAKSWDSGPWARQERPDFKGPRRRAALHLDRQRRAARSGQPTPQRPLEARRRGLRARLGDRRQWRQRQREHTSGMTLNTRTNTSNKRKTLMSVIASESEAIQNSWRISSTQ
jgi:penicillin-binding protein 1C